MTFISPFSLSTDIRSSFITLNTQPHNNTLYVLSFTKEDAPNDGYEYYQYVQRQTTSQNETQLYKLHPQTSQDEIRTYRMDYRRYSISDHS